MGYYFTLAEKAKFIYANNFGFIVNFPTFS